MNAAQRVPSEGGLVQHRLGRRAPILEELLLPLAKQAQLDPVFLALSNYRELVRAADAEKWFAITPAVIETSKAAREQGAKAPAGGERPANVVDLPTKNCSSVRHHYHHGMREQDSE